jgi:transcriptional regulator with XRE-family HTH domain
MITGMAPSRPATGFAGRLHQALKASGLTQQEVAEKVGLGGRQAIQPYLTGRVEPILKRVEQLASALCVEPGWLAGWQEYGGARPENSESLHWADFEKAVLALYRYAWRHCMDPGKVPTNPTEHRAYYRREDRKATTSAQHALKNGENPEGCRVRLPLDSLSYQVERRIVLRDDAGVIAEVQRNERWVWREKRWLQPKVMWVIPSTARRIMQDEARPD